jgi:hypothetical protein
MMKTVLFLLALWCCLGLAQFVTTPPAQPVVMQAKTKVVLQKAATASASEVGQKQLGMPISVLNVF